MPDTLFFSYSQEDMKWLKLLKSHFTPLQNEGLLKVWDDQELRASDSRGWEETLLGKLRRADVIMVLLSPSYASSKYCQKEIKLILARKRDGTAKVFLVLVRPVELEKSLATFQIRPSKDRAISTEPNEDAACRRLVQEVRDELHTAVIKPEFDSIEDWIPFYNREAQVLQLESLLDASLSVRHRPLCFLVAGPEREFHEMLHERLARRPLPKKLLGKTENPNSVRPVTLPSEIPKDGNLIKMITGRIEEGLDTACDELADGLSYLRIRIKAERKFDPLRMKAECALSQVQRKMCHTLLKFLNSDFPDIPKGKALCVGVSIEWDYGGLGHLYLRRAFPENNFASLMFRVLPDLQSPDRENVHDWVDEISRLKAGGLSLLQQRRLKEVVLGVFGSAQSLPMYDMNQRLTERSI